MIAFTVIKKVIGWVADNWDWLKTVIIGVLIAIMAVQAAKTAFSIACAVAEAIAWAIANWELALFAIALFQLIAIWVILIAMVLSVVAVFFFWKNAAIDTCEAITTAIIIIGAALLLIGIITGALIWIIIGLVVLAIGIILMYFAEACGYINIGLQAIWNAILWLCNAICAIGLWLWALICNIALGIANFFIACFKWILTAGYNAFAGIGNFGIALGNTISAIAENIGIAFQNAWVWAKNTFWEFIADVLDGISKLEPVINGIAKLLDKDGIDFGGLSASARSKKGEYKEFVSVSTAWSSGINTFDYKDTSAAWNDGMNTYSYKDKGDAWSSGWNTFDTFQEGWKDDAYNSGYEWGKGIEDSINKWGSKYQTWDTLDGLSLDSIGEKLGLDLSAFDNVFPDMTDPAYDLSNPDNLNNALGGSGDGLGKDVGKIADKTGKIADSMDLTEEDLEYLRRIADMEWKKEYTTANITVDMSNYNTINGESDLDGIVTKLADKLYEEMNVVANGVYA